MCCEGSFMRRGVRIFFMVIGGMALAVLVAAIFGFAVMYLWNWLMPGLFGLKAIGYWQALGIVLLAKLLFGDFGHHHGHQGMHGRFRKKMKSFHRDYPEISENYREYRDFWESEGSKAFSEFLEKKQGRKED